MKSFFFALWCLFFIIVFLWSVHARAAVGGLPSADIEVGAIVVKGGLCSGVLVAPDTVLTAAHCLVRDKTAPRSGFDGDYGRAVFQNNKIRKITAFFAVNPDESRLDLAVVSIYPKITNIKPIPIASSYPKPRDLLVFIGLGSHKDCHAGEEGPSEPTRTAVLFFAEELSLSDYETRAVRLCPGDSGGPIVNLVERTVIGLGSAFRVHTGPGYRVFDRSRFSDAVAFLKGACAVGIKTLGRCE